MFIGSAFVDAMSSAGRLVANKLFIAFPSLERYFSSAPSAPIEPSKFAIQVPSQTKMPPGPLIGPEVHQTDFKHSSDNVSSNNDATRFHSEKGDAAVAPRFSRDWVDSRVKAYMAKGAGHGNQFLRDTSSTDNRTPAEKATQGATSGQLALSIVTPFKDACAAANMAVARTMHAELVKGLSGMMGSASDLRAVDELDIYAVVLESVNKHFATSGYFASLPNEVTTAVGYVRETLVSLGETAAEENAASALLVLRGLPLAFVDLKQEAVAELNAAIKQAKDAGIKDPDSHPTVVAAKLKRDAAVFAFSFANKLAAETGVKQLLALAKSALRAPGSEVETKASGSSADSTSDDRAQKMAALQDSSAQAKSNLIELLKVVGRSGD
ncbi:MAG TPA: hypothetical protein VLJ86_07040 [Ramlibacter sp.]|nr:hypothetical protein [Ramlibacter sp.]